MAYQYEQWMKQIKEAGYKKQAEVEAARKQAEADKIATLRGERKKRRKKREGRQRRNRIQKLLRSSERKRWTSLIGG